VVRVPEDRATEPRKTEVGCNLNPAIRNLHHKTLNTKYEIQNTNKSTPFNPCLTT